MVDIVKLVPKEGNSKEDSLAAWLRALAVQVENGGMPSSAAAVVFVVETNDEQFCCRMRYHGMHYLGVLGAFQTMTNDMLES